MKTAIIIGGSGYIGGYLLTRLLQSDYFDIHYVYDIRALQGFEEEIKNGKVVYIEADVREKLPIPNLKIDGENSWIFNLAAIHREPGHKFNEYFDTNIPGAKHVNAFAGKHGIRNIFFTSSIAPYGKSLEKRTENSPLYPETAYGISKAIAEKLHQIWLAEDTARRLVIVRPSVIFGPKDPGNVFRMIKALKRGTFILPDGGRVIKAYGYVYGLIDSILFTMEKEERLIVYNYAENPLIPLSDMTKVIKEEFGYRKPIFKLSVHILSVLALFLQAISKLTGKKTEIHPMRVRKAGFPTNIEPRYLIENGFNFKYDLLNALRHWNSVAPEDFS